MTRDEILNMPAGREMDVTIGYHVIDLVAPPDIYPNYSTDISAAWEVVEKLNIPIGLIESILQDSWSCEVLVDPERVETIEVQAETAPLAICRAALLAVMDEKNPL